MLVEINREISFIEISTILNTKISNDEEYYALKGRIIHDLCIDIEIKNLDLSLLNCNNITYDSKINPNMNHIYPEILNKINFDWYIKENNFIPELPDKLEELIMDEGCNSKIEKLPSGLIELYCNHNYDLIELPKKLPLNLRFLSLYSCCNLTYLPIIPNSLKYLYIGNTKIKDLPELPDSLEILTIFDTEIKILPELPNSLKHLNIDNTKIKDLPELPNSLKHLSMDDTIIENLPELPNSLEELECSRGNLKYLPKLNKNIKIKIFNNKNLIEHIEYNPNMTLSNNSELNFNIKGYDKKICNVNDLNLYMEFLKFKINKVKSARK